MEFYPSGDFDTDGFPENTELDFDPVLIRRVFLSEDGKVFADVYGDPDFSLEADTVLKILESLANSNTFTNPNYDKNPENYPPFTQFIMNTATDLRGPFIDNEQVEKWLIDSGLRRIAIPYYDAENDEFWIDVNTN